MPVLLTVSDITFQCCRDLTLGNGNKCMNDDLELHPSFSTLTQLTAFTILGNVPGQNLKCILELPALESLKLELGWAFSDGHGSLSLVSTHLTKLDISGRLPGLPGRPRPCLMVRSPHDSPPAEMSQEVKYCKLQWCLIATGLPRRLLVYCTSR